MRNICVFLGANVGSRPQYKKSVVSLAEQIVKKKFGLVYGGASIGLMRELADTALVNGGVVTGIIPESLASQEITHCNLSKLYVVKTMQERKAMMSELSDAFIVFPGGIGTLEETFEVWNAIKIGQYRKPLGLLNIDGYFDPLLKFLNHSMAEGFIKQEHLDLVVVSSCPILLLDNIIAAVDERKVLCKTEKLRYKLSG